MSENCTHNCETCGEKCGSKAIPKEQTNEFSRIKKVIGVVSGKGGVGKSIVTGLCASLMAKKGYKTAILDADITGPSIPKMFGIKEHAVGNGTCILPCETKSGIKVMSLNLLVESETTPVVWRGPVIAGTVKQFWTDVYWDDVDYMFVDMPPGTGDVPLTVFQSLPVDGIIVVASPQKLVSMIVAKALEMAKLMKVPVLGIVENMSYIKCPDCGKAIKIFGEGDTHEVAAKYGTDVLAKLPIDPILAELCDNGELEDYDTALLEKAVETVLNV